MGGWGLISQQRCSQCILQPQPTELKDICIACIIFVEDADRSNKLRDICLQFSNSLSSSYVYLKSCWSVESNSQERRTVLKRRVHQDIVSPVGKGCRIHRLHFC